MNKKKMRRIKLEEGSTTLGKGRNEVEKRKKKKKKISCDRW